MGRLSMSVVGSMKNSEMMLTTREVEENHALIVKLDKFHLVHSDARRQSIFTAAHQDIYTDGEI